MVFLTANPEGHLIAGKDPFADLDFSILHQAEHDAAVIGYADLDFDAFNHAVDDNILNGIGGIEHEFFEHGSASLFYR